jgi:hypothetical protein
MRIFTFGLLSCMVLMCAGSAFGQQEKGDVELQLVGTYFATVGIEDYSFGSGTISGRVGYYFTDRFELGVGPTLSISTTTTQVPPSYTYDPNTGQIITTGGGTESNTTTTFGSYAFMVYSFMARGAKAVPYLGAQYFKSDFSNSEDKGSVGVSAGLKYFFAKKAAIDFGGTYMWNLTKDVKGGTIFFSVGLSFLVSFS